MAVAVGHGTTAGESVNRVPLIDTADGTTAGAAAATAMTVPRVNGEGALRAGVVGWNAMGTGMGVATGVPIADVVPRGPGAAPAVSVITKRLIAGFLNSSFSLGTACDDLDSLLSAGWLPPLPWSLPSTLELDFILESFDPENRRMNSRERAVGPPWSVHWIVSSPILPRTASVGQKTSFDRSMLSGCFTISDLLPFSDFEDLHGNRENVVVSDTHRTPKQVKGLRILLLFLWGAREEETSTAAPFGLSS